jgi:hypothetical protein
MTGYSEAIRLARITLAVVAYVSRFPEVGCPEFPLRRRMTAFITIIRDAHHRHKTRRARQ